MKPLQTLDQVMLWVARIFVIYFLGEFLYIAGVLIQGDYRWVVRTFARHGSFVWNFDSEGFVFPALLAAWALWMLSLFSRRRDASRLTLALSGVAFFLVFLWRDVDGLFYYGYAMNVGEWMLTGPALGGFFAMAWAAFRAPGQPPLSLKPAMRSGPKGSTPTPPISLVFFRHTF